MVFLKKFFNREIPEIREPKMAGGGRFWESHGKGAGPPEAGTAVLFSILFRDSPARRDHLLPIYDLAGVKVFLRRDERKRLLLSAAQKANDFTKYVIVRDPFMIMGR